MADLGESVQAETSVVFEQTYVFEAYVQILNLKHSTFFYSGGEKKKSL